MKRILLLFTLSFATAPGRAETFGHGRAIAAMLSPAGSSITLSIAPAPGARANRSYSLVALHGAADGRDDLSAWDHVDSLATIEPADVSFVYAVPDGFWEDNAVLRFALLPVAGDPGSTPVAGATAPQGVFFPTGLTIAGVDDSWSMELDASFTGAGWTGANGYLQVDTGSLPVRNARSFVRADYDGEGGELNVWQDGTLLSGQHRKWKSPNQTGSFSAQDVAVHIFALGGSGGTAMYPTAGTLFSARFRHGGELVADLVPCLDGGAAVLYDRVTGETVVAAGGTAVAGETLASALPDTVGEALLSPVLPPVFRAAPVVSGVGRTEATVSGSLVTFGGDPASCSLSLLLGLESDLSDASPFGAAVTPDPDTGAFSFPLSGLVPGATYYASVASTNAQSGLASTAGPVAFATAARVTWLYDGGVLREVGTEGGATGWELNATLGAAGVSVTGVRTAGANGDGAGDPFREIDLSAPVKDASGASLAVTALGSGAFANCAALGRVVLPDGVTEIPNYCFQGSSLRELHVGPGIRRVGSWAFLWARSLEVIEPSRFSALRAIGDNAFNDTPKLTVDFDVDANGLAFEGRYNFAGSGIRSFRANGVFTNAIPDSAFSGCPSLGEVRFGGGAVCGATSIGGSAFFRCTALTNFLPSSFSKLASIGGVAFHSTPRLAVDFTVESPLFEFVGNQTFAGSGVTGFFVNGTFTNAIPSSAFNDCAALRAAAFGSFRKCGVTTVDGAAFSRCTALRTLVLPSCPSSFASDSFSGVAAGAMVVFIDSDDPGWPARYKPWQELDADAKAAWRGLSDDDKAARGWPLRNPLGRMTDVPLDQWVAACRMALPTVFIVK